MLEVQVISTDLPKVVARLQRAGNPLVLRGEIRGGMSGVGPQARRAVASAALAIPAKGPRHTGLRRRMARAAQARTVNTASGPTLVIGVQRSVMGPQASLPKHLERGFWRHPLFGNKNYWYRQEQGSGGWFSHAITNDIVPLMERAMEKTAEKIARSFVK